MPKCARQAPFALGELGCAEERTVGAMSNLLRDPERAVRRAAAKALSQGGEAVAPVAAKLIAALRDPDELVRYHCVAALDKAGPRCGALLPAITLALAHCLLDSSPRVQGRAVQAHANLAPRVPQPQSASAADEPLRMEPNPPVLDTLRERMTRGAPAERISACLASFSLGAGQAEVTPVLLEALADPAPETRLAAVSALGHIACRGDAVLDALEERRQDPDQAVRDAVRDTLKRLRTS